MINDHKVRTPSTTTITPHQYRLELLSKLIVLLAANLIMTYVPTLPMQ